MSVYLRERKLSNGRTRFYLDIYHNNKRTYEWLFAIEKDDDKEQKKALAKTIRNQREIEIESSGTAFVPKHKKNVKLYKYFEAYMANYDKKDKRLVEASITKFKQFGQMYKVNENTYFSELTETHFSKYADYLNNKAGLKGETPNNYWKKFKSIIIQATRDKYINRDIYETVIFKRKEDYSDTAITKDILEQSEIELLFNTKCGNYEVKKAFLFACYSGMGLAELQGLTWREIKGGRLVTKRKKSGKKIDLEIPERALLIIGNRGQISDEVFNLKNPNGKYLSENGINKTLLSWVKRAQIQKHITFYCARHTFAVRLLLNDTNLKTVADLMGHSNTKITSKYLGKADQLKDKAMKKLL